MGLEVGIEGLVFGPHPMKTQPQVFLGELIEVNKFFSPVETRLWSSIPFTILLALLP